MLKSLISRILLQCGMDLRRAASVPFGVRWHEDIRFLLQGQKLETVFDVGANIGQTALTLARNFPESRVFSFEPIPSTFARLAQNTGREPRIEAVCCALGSEPGSGKMTTEPLSVSNTLLVEPQTNPKTPVTDVNIDTVSSFCAKRGIQRLSLLKIDTEGYEMNVLKGAERLLVAKQIEFVLCECDFFRRNGEPHGDFNAIWQYLSSLNYHVVAFYSGGVDDLGWIWGDVLFRLPRDGQRGRVSCSPFAR